MLSDICLRALFREANSFRERSLRKIVSFQEQIISVHMFAPNKGYCANYPSNIFRIARLFQNWELSHGYAWTYSVAWRVYANRARAD